MFESNIVVGSNVFFSREEDPMFDQTFVDQVVEYKCIRAIYKRREVDFRVANLSKVQHGIRKTECRCIYAQNDPCFGYSKEKNKVVCACINRECSHILECNPDYSDEMAKEWSMTDEERLLYGNPSKLSLYYKVDMISEEEMMRYECNPLNDGLEFPINTNPVIPDYNAKEDTNTYMINPLNGRRMVVIGHKWRITDNNDYQNEELVPIWGYVDEVADRKTIARKKTKKIEKKESRHAVKNIETPGNNTETDDINKNLYEERVRNRIRNCYKFTELEEKYFSADKNVILVDNLAEKAYVSSMLLLSEIKHGFSNDDRVNIVVLDDYKFASTNAKIVLTSNVLKGGSKKDNLQIWKLLSNMDEVYELSIPDREYYEYKYDNKSRWCCRNLYGVTHVVVDENDIADFDVIKDGEYYVSIVEEKNGYMILERDGNILGHLNNEFGNMINALKVSGNIASSPAVIKGIKIIVLDGKKIILGMGNLKFIEY
ncbi:MAG: hypothetical protein MJ131_05300 [Lachnospiraceae bacterium]|nr:hypothetical protein [Lachnospiraceae bacterium]